jgi:hypothetical protein
MNGYGRIPPRHDLDFVVGVDLGQSRDYTAIAVVERVRTVTFDPDTLEEQPATVNFQLRHLERPELGTAYPAIVERCISLLDRAPLSRETPLVVDRTGVGRAVTDIFTAAGVEPVAVTIHGGDEVIREGKHYRVPKRELVGTLIALYQTGRLKVAESLALAPALANELLNFKVKVDLRTAHDSYESWRESVHDDLVLAVALACWYAEHELSKHEPMDEGTIRYLQAAGIGVDWRA